MIEAQTLEQLAGRLAHFMTFRPAEVSINASSLSDEDLNAHLSALKTAIDDDNVYLGSELPQRAWYTRDFDHQSVTQAVSFLERKYAFDVRYQEARALQQEQQRRILRASGFNNIDQLREELGLKRSKRTKLEESWFVKKQKRELDTQIGVLKQADRGFRDNESIAYVHVNNRDLRKVMLSYATQILQQYTAQINQFATLQPALLDSLVKDYLERHFVYRDGYRTLRGHNVFLGLPPDAQRRIVERATREFESLTYLAGGEKAIEIVESRKRAAQTLLEAVQAMGKSRDSTVDYDHSDREELKRQSQDILHKDYSAYLMHVVKEGITPEIWQVFSSRKEVTEMYEADVLQRVRGNIGAIIWEKLLKNPHDRGSVSAFAFTPVNQVPYLVMNFWAQRDSHDESPIMREIGDVLTSFLEQEVRQMEGLNVPGLMDVVRTLRASPKALGSMGMTGTEENKIIDEGLVKMCAYYLQHGTPEERYFALRTSATLNCMVLTSTDHFNSVEYQRQRGMLTPHIASILQIPEVTLKERKTFIEIVPYVVFGSFTFDNMQAGKSFRRHG